jgi:DNA-binding NarL/FixJ family response regulator
VTRILIVDDHEVVRRGLRQILAEAVPSCVVAEAGDSAGALGAIAGTAWDLLILDVNIPGRSGLEVLEDAKRLRPGMPVLVVSAYPEEELAVRCIRLGAAGYLGKNTASTELVGAVRKVLSGGKYVTARLAERLMEVLGGQAAAVPHDALSSRELQVLRLVASGRSSKQIAAELHLSEKTIATYRSRIAEKLGLSTAVELTRFALQHGLVA